MPVRYADTDPASGILVHCTLTDPADANLTGYDAIAEANWSKFDLITSLSGLPAPTRSFNETPTLEGQTLVVRGNETMADLNWTCAYDLTSPGQALVQANANGKNRIHWRFTLDDAGTRKIYFASNVTGFAPTVSDIANGFLAANLVIKPIFELETGNGVVLPA